VVSTRVVEGTGCHTGSMVFATVGVRVVERVWIEGVAAVAVSGAMVAVVGAYAVLEVRAARACAVAEALNMWVFVAEALTVQSAVVGASIAKVAAAEELTVKACAAAEALSAAVEVLETGLDYAMG
jgi:hypothetical protein